ncbi:diguanylate cyclase [Catenovulum sp. SX2]|uniref:sensor domain-containing diguanylate cyclase n=1 Tax=Catenovulum sp. SX2 TaxID=3398614 RepID=UPI003F8753EF
MMDTFKPAQTYNHKTAQSADSTLNAITDIIAEGTWDWNADTGIVTRNPSWYRMLGYDVGVFRPDVFTWENIIHPDDLTRVLTHFEQYTQGQINTYQIEYRCKKADGSYIWIRDQGKVIERDENGEATRMIGAHLNIDEIKCLQSKLAEAQASLQLRKQNKLDVLYQKKSDELACQNRLLEEKVKEFEHISLTDPLTDVGNRKFFEYTLKKELARAERYHFDISLVLFDVDFFKQVNDTYGHSEGDKILQVIAKTVSVNIREVDTLARWGGEEFVVILPELNEQQAYQVAEKLRQLLSEIEHSCQKCVTCSFGLVVYQKGQSSEELFVCADKALYLAKQSGRNRVEMYQR